MANHVMSTIAFYNLTEEAYDALEAISTQADIISMFGELEENVDRSWMLEHIGAKWIVVDDFSDKELFVTTAWSPPIELCDFMYNYLSEHYNCKDHAIFMTYEDEMPNFVGYYGIYGEDISEEELNTEEEFEQTIGQLPSFENEDWLEALGNWFLECEESFLRMNRILVTEKTVV